MTAKQLVCVNCRNWNTEKCGECCFYAGNRIDVSCLEFECYEHTFLTPEQWEQRTGDKWKGLLWVWIVEHEHGTYGGDREYWAIEYNHAGMKYKRKCVCNCPEAPGDDWEGI